MVKLNINLTASSTKCFLSISRDLLSMYNRTQFVQRFLISVAFNCFSLYVFIVRLFILLICIYNIYIYIHCFNFTIHLIMTEVRSKRRFLPLKSVLVEILTRLIVV